MGKGKVELQFPTRWSYSAWSGWKECAFRFYRQRVMGEKEPPSWPMLKGIELHTKAEHYLKGNVTVLPKELESFKYEYRELKKCKPIVEEFWGVDKEWNFMEGEGAWGVMKMDAAIPPMKMTKNRLYMQDLKTGNEYASHFDQGDLYATIGLARYKEADGVEVEFWYSKGGYVTTFQFENGKDQQRRIAKWVERGSDMLAPNQKYLPSPSENGCKWCFLRSDKGGVCHAWKKLRN